MAGRSSAPFAPHSCSSGRNSPADKIEVSEREERKHLRAVLGNATIADLAIAKLALDDAQHVPDLGAHFAEARLRARWRFVSVRPRFALSFTGQSTPASSAARFLPQLA
jgi:hypothetical protein